MSGTSRRYRSFHSFDWFLSLSDFRDVIIDIFRVWDFEVTVCLLSIPVWRMESECISILQAQHFGIRDGDKEIAGKLKSSKTSKYLKCRILVRWVIRFENTSYNSSRLNLEARSSTSLWSDFSKKGCQVLLGIGDGGHEAGHVNVGATAEEGDHVICIARYQEKLGGGYSVIFCAVWLRMDKSDGNYPSLSNNNVGAATTYINGIISIGIQGYKLECCKVQKEAHLGKPRESFGVRYSLLDEGTSNITLMNKFRDQMLALMMSANEHQLVQTDRTQSHRKTALSGGVTEQISLLASIIGDLMSMRLGNLLDDDEFHIDVPESHTFHLWKLLHIHTAGQDASRPTHRCCTLTQATCMQAARVVHPRSRTMNGEWLEWGWMPPSPPLSTTACAGSYSHPSPSVVPETPNANISYSQQILPVLPSSSVPRIVPSNTSTSLIRGMPAMIGLFRARKSLTTLPPYTSPFPYHNYTLNFTVRSPVPTQNVLVQTEVSTEDGGEGERVGEEEEEDEEHMERDEAKLVLEVARVQRKVCRTEQQLSIARIEETDALGNLYRFRAEDAERKLNHAEFDLRHFCHSIWKNGVSLCNLPSTRKCCQMSDNGLTSMVTLWITPFLSHNLYR
ncbi:hypothetical protein BKA83DRAFT_4126071 [Pisolithus microcarpus]|nr:hypothetical protein BKA83DRAFT_4126071 [Pisolithus microcarpus]